jgi:hypothetical protein
MARSKQKMNYFIHIQDKQPQHKSLYIECIVKALTIIMSISVFCLFLSFLNNEKFIIKIIKLIEIKQKKNEQK